MRLATWEHSGTVSSGVVVDGNVHAFPGYADLIDVLTAGATAPAEASDRAMTIPGVPLTQIRLLPPVTPPSVRDFVCFHEHLEGVAARFGDRVVVGNEVVAISRARSKPVPMRTGRRSGRPSNM